MFFHILFYFFHKFNRLKFYVIFSQILFHIFLRSLTFTQELTYWQQNNRYLDFTDISDISDIIGYIGYISDISVDIFT